MQIKALHIQAFGGLRDFSWQPAASFSLLYGPNESGKSTIWAFIHAMFYGLGRRNQNLAKNARQRYLPWQHPGEMGGSLDFSFKGQDYRLERSFGPLRSQDQVSLYNQSLFEQVSLAHPDQPGLDLFQLSEDNFLLACHMAQAQDTGNPQALNQLILQLQATGREDQASSSLTEKLQKEAKALRGGSQGGSLAQAQREVRELEEDLGQALTRDQNLQISREQLKLLQAQLAAAEAALSYYQQEADLTVLQAKMQAWQDYQRQKADRLDQVKDQLGSEQAKLQVLPARELGFLTSKADQVEGLGQAVREADLQIQQAEEDIRQLSLQLHQARQKLSQAEQEAKSLQEKIRAGGWDRLSDQRPPSRALLVLAGGLGLSLVLTVILALLEIPQLLLGGLGLLILTLLAFALVKVQEQKQFQAYQVKLTRRHKYLEASRLAQEQAHRAAWLLERVEEDLARKEEQRQARIQLQQAARHRYESARQDLRLTLKPWYPDLGQEDPLAAWHKVKNFSLSAQLRALEARGLRQVDEEELARMQATYEAAQEEAARVQQAREDLLQTWPHLAQGPREDREAVRALAHNLRDQLAAQKAEVASLQGQGQDTASLEAALALAQEDLDRQEEASQVVSLAQAILQRALASYQLQSQPQLQARAQAWLARLTQGRYQELQVSSGGDLALATSPEDHYHADAYYSTGTRDLVYLSLRLALAEMLSQGQGLTLPLYLDDSLSNLDQERLETALASLNQHAEESSRQIILATASRPLWQLGQDWGFCTKEIQRLN